MKPTNEKSRAAARVVHVYSASDVPAPTSRGVPLDADTEYRVHATFVWPSKTDDVAMARTDDVVSADKLRMQARAEALLAGEERPE